MINDEPRVSPRYVVYDPESSLAVSLCKPYRPDKDLLNLAAERGYSAEELQDSWGTVPHSCWQPQVTCSRPYKDHGFFPLEELGGIIVCPGDRILLSEGKPWAVSDPDGSRVRLLSNGSMYVVKHERIKTKKM